jgi:hypothetical protein
MKNVARNEAAGRQALDPGCRQPCDQHRRASRRVARQEVRAHRMKRVVGLREERDVASPPLERWRRVRADCEL